MIRDQRPNFKVESTEAKITPRAGLVLVERMAQALGLPDSLDFRLGYLKRRKRGYRICDKVMDLVRLSVAGGSAVSDIRSLRNDEVVKGFLGRETLMSCSTAVEFLLQLGECEVEHLSAVCGCAVTDTLMLNENQVATLDVDATFIQANKREAKYSFHKEPGYYPMLSFVAETRQLLLAEFKDGNASPSSGALKFLKQLVSRLPETITKKRLRSDSAWFNVDVMDHCADNDIEFAITAGFSLEHLPSGRFYSNAAYLQIVGLAYNLVGALKILSLPPSFRSYTIKTLRFHLIHIAGLWVRHARRWVLKISAPEHLIALFQNVLIQPLPNQT